MSKMAYNNLSNALCISVALAHDSTTNFLTLLRNYLLGKRIYELRQLEEFIDYIS